MQMPCAHGSLTERAVAKSPVRTASPVYFEGVPSARESSPGTHTQTGFPPVGSAARAGRGRDRVAAAAARTPGRISSTGLTGSAPTRWARPGRSRPPGRPRATAPWPPYLRQVLPILQQEASQLRALRRPPGATPTRPRSTATCRRSTARWRRPSGCGMPPPVTMATGCPRPRPTCSPARLRRWPPGTA